VKTSTKASGLRFVGENTNKGEAEIVTTKKNTDFPNLKIRDERSFSFHWVLKASILLIVLVVRAAN